MTIPPLVAEQRHLAGLLEAIQRCVYFLQASRAKAPWPLQPEELAARYKEIALFETLAAMNERFAKLQDTLGAYRALVQSSVQAPSAQRRRKRRSAKR
ncbi:hypothetical protein CKO42_13830 [Lamprobacter modestohalophilus]|uniref:Uncharacterized protein n=1 Tax=Lamprobacter modestohalophilus TaxID=1064514 RepID=A0A9X0W9X6_9GAMM|nr:hypothetical protein [Lamprobacter modestohalophilus]MBK1619496.1 hypothetical protein [Lamprobacter modestohalophilus]MCF8017092.1 hypothetical protein [Chromatiaceae bacterium]